MFINIPESNIILLLKSTPDNTGHTEKRINI